MYQPLRRYLLLSAAIAASPAIAQEGEDILLDPIRIERVGAQDVLGNAEITEDEIEARNPATIRDVFAGESSITASGGAPIAQKVFVNGIEESLLSVTIDGARQNKSAFHHTGNVLFDPALLKRVDVSEGIAPADAGPGGVGGAIAYTTKDARDFLDPGEAFGGRTQLSFDSNGDTARGTLTLFGQSGGFEWLLSGTRQAGDDYEDGDGDEVPGTESDLTDAIVKLAHTSESGDRLSFSYSKTEDTGTRPAQAGPGGILFTRPDFAAVVGRDSTFIDGYSRRTSYSLTYTDETPQGWLAPTLQLAYNEQEIDASGVWGENTSLSGTASNEFDIGTGSVTAGIDFFNETAEGEGRAAAAPFNSSGEEELFDIGIFAQARQDLTDRLSASYGARYDWQRFEAASGEEFEDGGVSINGALDFTLTDALSLNAGYASTWGGYELGEAALVNFGGDWTYDGFTASRAKSARLGLRYETGPWEARGALFRTEVEDIAAVLPSGGDRGALADLTSEGFEVSLGWTGMRGFAELNFTKANVDLDEETIGTTAYYFGRPVGDVLGIQAAYDVTDRLTLGGTVQAALENDDTGVTLDGYKVANTYASYVPAGFENIELRLDVRNLFNETYSARSSDGIGVDNVIPLNEPGRSVAITASMRF